MNDIVQQLRNHERHAVHDADDTCIAAADLIESLRGLLRIMHDSKRADGSPLLIEYWRDRIKAALTGAADQPQSLTQQGDMGAAFGPADGSGKWPTAAQSEAGCPECGCLYGHNQEQCARAADKSSASDSSRGEPDA